MAALHRIDSVGGQYQNRIAFRAVLAQVLINGHDGDLSRTGKWIEGRGVCAIRNQLLIQGSCQGEDKDVG